MFKKLTVLIVDDHDDILIGLKSRLNHIFSDQVHILEAKNAREAESKARQHNIDLLICDLQLKQIPSNQRERDGYELNALLKEENLITKSIAYSTFSDISVLHKVKQYMFNAYMAKNSRLPEFKETVFGVLENDTFVSESSKKIKQAHYESNERNNPGFLGNISSLTTKEMSIFLDISDVEHISELASKHAIKESTCKDHLKNIRQKLKVTNKDMIIYLSKFYKVYH